jgi:hypothetical protein
MQNNKRYTELFIIYLYYFITLITVYLLFLPSPLYFGIQRVTCKTYTCNLSFSISPCILQRGMQPISLPEGNM